MYGRNKHLNIFRSPKVIHSKRYSNIFETFLKPVFLWRGSWWWGRRLGRDLRSSDWRYQSVLAGGREEGGMVMTRAGRPVATHPPEVSRFCNTNKKFTEDTHLRVEREVCLWTSENIMKSNTGGSAIRNHFWRGFETTDVKNAMALAMPWIMLETNNMLSFVRSLQKMCQCWYSCIFVCSSSKDRLAIESRLWRRKNDGKPSRFRDFSPPKKPYQSITSCSVPKQQFVQTNIPC